MRGAMATWTFVAALSWLMVATIGLFVTIVSAFTVVAFSFAVLVGVAAVAIPFVVARGLLERSVTLGLLGAVYAFGMGAYAVSEFGLTSALVILVWLGLASGMATRELRASD